MFLLRHSLNFSFDKETKCDHYFIKVLTSVKFHPLTSISIHMCGPCSNELEELDLACRKDCEDQTFQPIITQSRLSPFILQPGNPVVKVTVSIALNRSQVTATSLQKVVP